MKYFLLFFLLIGCVIASAQNRNLDSLNSLLIKASIDTTRINLMNQISNELQTVSLDSAILFSTRTIIIAKSKHYTRGEAEAHRLLGASLAFKSNFTEAKDQLQIAERLFSSLPDSSGIGKLFSTYGVYYGLQSKYDTSNFFLKKGLVYIEHSPDKIAVNTVYQNIAINYQMQSDFIQALLYYNKALYNADAAHDYSAMAYIYLNMATVYEALNDDKRTKSFLEKAIDNAKQTGDVTIEQYAYANLSSLYMKQSNFAKCYEFAMKAADLGKITGDQAIVATSLSHASAALAYEGKFKEAETLNNKAVALADSFGQPINKFQTLKDKGFILKLQNKYKEAIPFYEKAFTALQNGDIYVKETGEAYDNLSECYEKTENYGKALTNFKIAARIKDSVTSRDNVRKATELSMNYDFDKKQQAQQAAQEKEDRENTIKLIFLVAILLVFITLSTVSLLAYKREQKAKALVNTQKREVESTLAELKTTQAQLIHAEKMASLGELTAGIAHEIQNPLNFVNNFSELNKEMIAEMKEEIDKGNYEEVKLLVEDIEANEEKITHHGKRADAIVKGMLQHSRKNTGQKEPININALCDEYLRLSYHGLRAKDKSFNANFTTDFEETIGNISIVPQDIGRVLLNLFNNAFYAVNEKKKISLPPLNGSEYKPFVTVTTKKINPANNDAAKNSPLGVGGIEIIVQDNGNGIPKHILDKIFQPFFTTKPTGEGTGLGLSMSYDIITKEHNGTIKVESTEGEGSVFIIQLPVA